MADPNSDAADQAELAELRAEVESLREKISEVRARHDAQLAALEVQHRAQLELATASTRAQIEHARTQAELQSVQLQAELIERDRESYLERLNALASELSEEIEVLLAFSREQATAYYTERVERESGVLESAEEAHKTARRHLAKKQAEAQASGQRTITQMAELDMGLNLARTTAHAAEVSVRDAKARVDDLKRKLAACREPAAG
ncbi:MAG: hypothetical protein IPI67_22430 [Myxococcales bacterium]|nr:hypothetical protein [Myxococcales bacterium]